MKIYQLILLLLSIFFLSCSNHRQGKELDEVYDLAAFLNGNTGQLFIQPEEIEQVIELLNAKDLGDNLYDIDINGSSLTVEIISEELPYIYALEFEEIPLDTIPGTQTWMKLYKNAECDWEHRGFVSPCRGTFGKHKKFGLSMIWTVKKWKSCCSGKGYCMEFCKSVGYIDYFPDPNCSDTIFVRRKIFRFRCD